MKIVRVTTTDGRTAWGRQADDGAVFEITGDLFSVYTVTDTPLSVQTVLTPCNPPNILAIGANYKKHIEECGRKIPSHPMLFIKATSSATANGMPLIIPSEAPDEVDYEAELGIVIGKITRNVTEAQAPDSILGYTCVNDVSARDVQLRHDIQWARGKSFDSFTPFGPCIETDIDPNRLAIGSRLNGEVMQDSNTADMVAGPFKIVSFLSRQLTLLPGTLILTGTPEGVGFGRTLPRYMKAGDTIEVEIEGIGTLTNPVVNES